MIDEVITGYLSPEDKAFNIERVLNDPIRKVLTSKHDFFN